MKSKFKFFTVILVLMTSCMTGPRYTVAQPPPSPSPLQEQSDVSFQLFYDELNPYGQWVDYDQYGYVWIPDTRGDFMPYSTNGQWVLTDYGWTWLSDYEWGWAAFHYGRWSYEDSFGWFWVPDNEWGPAWVNWRQADGYYGWSPMEPGISVNASFGRRYDRSRDYWVFVKDRDIARPNIHNYYVGRNEHDLLVRNSTVIRNTYTDRNRRTTYVTGPRRTDVQRVTGRTIQPLKVQEYNKPGHELKNDRLQIYRPRVEKNTADRSQRAAPKRVTNINEVRRSPARDASNPNQMRNPDDNNRSREPNDVNRRAEPTKRSPDNDRANPNRIENRDRQPVEENRQVEPTRRFPDRTNPNQGGKQDNTPTRRFNDVNTPNRQPEQDRRVPENRPAQNQIGNSNNNQGKQQSDVNRTNPQSQPNVRVPEKRSNPDQRGNSTTSPDIVIPQDNTKQERQPAEMNPQKPNAESIPTRNANRQVENNKQALQRNTNAPANSERKVESKAPRKDNPYRQVNPKQRQSTPDPQNKKEEPDTSKTKTNTRR